VVLRNHADDAPNAPDDTPNIPDDSSIDGAASSRFLPGTSCIENVPAAVWNDQVSGKQVLTQWLSHRRRNRERPIIGDRRPPSSLGNNQPDHWLPEYTTELQNALHVLTLLVDLEPQQADVLERVLLCELISESSLAEAGALTDNTPMTLRTKFQADTTPDLFERP
jgi:hypothetical protein